MTITQITHNQEWHDGVLVADEVVQVDVTATAVTFEIHQKARAALVANGAALDQLPAAQAAIATAFANGQTIINAPVTNITQAATQIDALAAEIRRIANVVDGMLVAQARALRVDNQFIRYVLALGGAPDLLVENSDT